MEMALAVEATLQIKLLKIQDDYQALVNKIKIENVKAAIDLKSKLHNDDDEFKKKQDQERKEFESRLIREQEVFKLKQKREEEIAEKEALGRFKQVEEFIENVKSPVDESYSSDLKKELKCPVCFEEMKPPVEIWQCSQGHPICQPCKYIQDISHCLTCRQEIVGRANLVEKIAVRVFAKQNKFRGRPNVEYTVQSEVFRNHEDSLGFMDARGEERQRIGSEDSDREVVSSFTPTTSDSEENSSFIQTYTDSEDNSSVPLVYRDSEDNSSLTHTHSDSENTSSVTQTNSDNEEASSFTQTNSDSEDTHTNSESEDTSSLTQTNNDGEDTYSFTQTNSDNEDTSSFTQTYSYYGDIVPLTQTNSDSEDTNLVPLDNIYSESTNSFTPTNSDSEVNSSFTQANNDSEDNWSFTFPQLESDNDINHLFPQFGSDNEDNSSFLQHESDSGVFPSLLSQLTTTSSPMVDGAISLVREAREVTRDISSRLRNMRETRRRGIVLQDSDDEDISPIISQSRARRSGVTVEQDSHSKDVLK